MNNAIDKVLAALGNGPRSAADVRRVTGLGESVVKDALQQLKRLGRVALEGAGRSARWGLVVTTGEHIDRIIIDPEPPAVDVVPVVEELDPTGAMAVGDEEAAPPWVAPDSLERRRRTLIGRVLVAIGREHLLIEGPVTPDQLLAEIEAGETGLRKMRDDMWAARKERDLARDRGFVLEAERDEALGQLAQARREVEDCRAKAMERAAARILAENARHQRDTALGLRERIGYREVGTQVTTIIDNMSNALALSGRAIEAAAEALAAMNGGNHE